MAAPPGDRGGDAPPLAASGEAPPAEAGADAAEAAEAAAPTAAERIASLEAEAAELREAHARALADHLNYRRRSEQRWADRERGVLAGAVRRFLPLLDDLALALDSAGGADGGEPWAEGVRLVHRKFRETVEACGLEAIATEDAAFDPRVHEAISYAPGAQGRIVATLRGGWAIGDYVVRPAQVVVGDGADEAAETAAAAGEA